MRAILLNADTRTVQEVDIDDNIDTIRKLIDCRCFTTAGAYDNGDTVYCDDEGLFCQPQTFISLGINNGYPIAGNVLIIGCGDEGESIDCKTSTTDIHNEVVWMDAADAIMASRY